MILTSLAGPYAEEAHRGRRTSIARLGAYGDYNDAMVLAECAVSREEELSAYIRWLEIRAKAMVDGIHGRTMIPALADALMERQTLIEEEARCHGCRCG